MTLGSSKGERTGGLTEDETGAGTEDEWLYEPDDTEDDWGRTAVEDGRAAGVVEENRLFRPSERDISDPDAMDCAARRCARVGCGSASMLGCTGYGP